jgi:hypothetical protein
LSSSPLKGQVYNTITAILFPNNSLKHTILQTLL